MMVYIDRLIAACSIPFSPLTAHRIVLTAFVTAVKFNDDTFYSNAFYANVGGVSTVEMNALEVEFLGRLDFRLFVDTDTFVDYYEEVAVQGMEEGLNLPELELEDDQALSDDVHDKKVEVESKEGQFMRDVVGLWDASHLSSQAQPYRMSVF